LFLNSFFCWPKLLPTAFLLLAVGLLWDRPRGQPLSSGTALLAGACAAFSLLGHGGSAFGLAAIAVVYIAQRRALSFRPIAMGAITLVLLMLPWQAYQRFCDPPGDRLVKYHLAGREPIDPRSSLMVIREAYEELSWRQILENKAINIQTLFGRQADWGKNSLEAFSKAKEGHWDDAFFQFAKSSREAGFFHYGQTLGPMTIGLLGLAWLWIRCRQRNEARAAGTLAALGAASAVIWCALMFKGGSTVIHQSSYFTGACLYAVAGIGLAALPRTAILAVLGANLAWFVAVWTLTPLHHPRERNWLLPAAFPGFWITWALLAAALLGCLHWISHLGHNSGGMGPPKQHC